jgi:hypothetical protein
VTLDRHFDSNARTMASQWTHRFMYLAISHPMERKNATNATNNHPRQLQFGPAARAIFKLLYKE